MPPRTKKGKTPAVNVPSKNQNDDSDSGILEAVDVAQKKRKADEAPSVPASSTSHPSSDTLTAVPEPSTSVSGTSVTGPSIGGADMNINNTSGNVNVNVTVQPRMAPIFAGNYGAPKPSKLARERAAKKEVEPADLSCSL
jgi:hypothetical protein